ncbi:monocarboxylate transporter 12-B-like isoform X1 [Biomphalaria glabrata]|uniref:Monocarboxylate transporter 12-B-like isoform X1 n=1 Tax=Biomphalaria glabrata TaxID=6526 RepID=A0A9W2Z1Z1_BIOGL|nr:monocarboxylate transporter 12-B-like isoform X1 [Biomphalaria glabrata]XP_055868961.1 monocarboxylate transporter 12-B-like isoform X1 [Biomphalaria glabrata]
MGKEDLSSSDHYQSQEEFLDRADVQLTPDQIGAAGVPGEHTDTSQKNDTIEAKDEEGNEENQPETGKSSVLQKAPDGGYGWVIVAASFFHHMIVGGIGRSEGLFFLQYQERFGSSAQMTAWPMSLMSTLNFCMGPITGALVSRYSVRTTLIMATLLTSTGLLLNGLAPNVYFLYFSTTLLGGFGRGLMSTVLLINLYFDKHRSLAHGLSSSGVGFGAFAIVPLVQFLFEMYGFMGAFLVIGALELNGLVTSMLFRPLRMHLKFLNAEKLYKKRLTNAEEGVALSRVQDDSDDMVVTESSQLGKCGNGGNFSGPSDAFIKDDDVESLQLQDEHEVSTSMRDRSRHRKNCCQSSLAVCFPVEHKRKGTEKGAETFHWHLLRNIPFLVFCFSNTFFLIAFKTAFTFLPSMAISKGLTKTEAALVLTISGALDTFGRIAIGFVMDIPACRPLRPYVFNMLLFFIAVASCVIPSLDSFAMYCVVSGAYGFMTGAFISQKMVVLVDILGREVMPSSLGISKFFQGMGTLVGPPFAGALRDALGSFDSSFYLGGACMFGSGLLLLLSNVLLKLQKSKQKTAS